MAKDKSEERPEGEPEEVFNDLVGKGVRIFGPVIFEYQEGQGVYIRPFRDDEREYRTFMKDVGETPTEKSIFRRGRK